MKEKNKSFLIRLTCAGLCLALCWLLPMITGQVQKIGNMLCPMHLPVLLCGFLCGPWFGAAVGILAPLTRSLLFSMPPLFPTAFSMAFELAAYGLLAGLFYRIFPKKTGYLYLSLILAMLGGRLVWGGVQFALMGAGKIEFSFAAFVTGAFTNAIPGILLQIILIPLLVLALRKARLFAPPKTEKNDRNPLQEEAPAVCGKNQ